jgi:voltage-gated potassium channel
MDDVKRPPQAKWPHRNGPEPRLAAWQHRLHEIIFEADTKAGKAFDVGLLLAIGVSVLMVMLESVESINKKWAPLLTTTEWIVTILFTMEYFLRIVCVGKPLRYILSFFGVIDLLAILPTYTSLFIPRTSSLSVIRSLRLLRVFRVLKLAQYLSEARTLLAALRRSRAKITVFFAFVMIVVLILGSAIYAIEGGRANTPFTSIPRSVYWAIVTVTTVGYGDIAPQTLLGQALAAIAMIIGYSIIVVPTGIVTADIFAESSVSTQACPVCVAQGHVSDAEYCYRCGARL